MKNPPAASFPVSGRRCFVMVTVHLRRLHLRRKYPTDAGISPLCRHEFKRRPGHRRPQRTATDPRFRSSRMIRPAFRRLPGGIRSTSGATWPSWQPTGGLARRDFQPRLAAIFSHTDSMDVKLLSGPEAIDGPALRQLTASSVKAPILHAQNRHILYVCPFTSSDAVHVRRSSRSSYAPRRSRVARSVGRPIRIGCSPPSLARSSSAYAALKPTAQTRSGGPARSTDASSVPRAAPAGLTADAAPPQQQRPTATPRAVIARVLAARSVPCVASLRAPARGSRARCGAREPAPAVS
jgi:hypothetical protein